MALKVRMGEGRELGHSIRDAKPLFDEILERVYR
jgi:hypothetical protein